MDITCTNRVERKDIMNKIIKEDTVLYLKDNEVNIDIDDKASVVIYHLMVDKSVNAVLDKEEPPCSK